MKNSLKTFIAGLTILVAPVTILAEAAFFESPASQREILLAQKEANSLILVDTSSSTSDLVQALQQSTLKYQRRYAAQLLGERKEPGTAPYLVQALDDPEDIVQKAAAEALVNQRDKSIFPQLIDTLSAPRPSAREYSAYVLGKLANKGDTAAIQALETAAGDEKSNVRVEVIYALYEIGSPSSKGIFVNGLNDEEARIRSYCANALGSLKTAGAGAELSAALDRETDESVRRTIISAMGKIGGSSSAKTLAQAVTNENASLRGDIADALGEIKTPEAIRALVELLADSNPTVRARAASALANARDPSSAGALANALKDRSPLVRRAASRALIYIADSTTIKELVDALGDSDSEVAENAKEALIHVNDLNAVHSLIDALDSGNPNKQTRALMVLEEITHRPYGSDVVKWVQWYEENFKTSE
ncbi:MAG: hypothetical protein C4520_21360 [Candidatus Abyssobacteria bacterium SURF_5]|uniref:HEAT repeat domain-containing protein n=1 Tax=Abyssobacteria bacterium (strain SURF_5) TaxID=2093360 RepID=A0A3A4N8B5_ABYX5|nr:MAG: hypothetical protein C4520_21360 [Candidatus Abyssubacteria bacterium SURF_5]